MVQADRIARINLPRELMNMQQNINNPQVPTPAPVNQMGLVQVVRLQQAP